MKKIEFKIIDNPDESRKYWDMFSPKEKIDDEWDFRYTWGKYLELPFHFIVGFDGEKPIGLLALQKNGVKGLGPKLLKMNKPFLEFFGGVDTDDNGVFPAKGYEDEAIRFYEQIKEPAILTSLKNEVEVKGIKSEFYLDRFSVNLEGITDFDSYIDKYLTGKTRKNVKHELRRSKLEGYDIKIENGNVNDLDSLFAFSIKRFRERSSFNLEYRRKIYRDFLDLYNIDIFKVILNGELKAVVYAVVYNKTYTGINIGYDYEIPSFGKYLFTKSVERAISLGCTTYDAGQGDNGYKRRLHVDQIPQYKLTLS